MSEVPTRSRPARPPIRGWVPLTVVLAVLVVGLGLVLVDWRLGLYICSAAFGLGAVLSLVLPRSVVGLLRVRNRFFDTAVLAVTGAALAVTTWLR